MKKKSSKNKDSVKIEIFLAKELAESVHKFKEVFKPNYHTIDGKIIEFTENEFWVSLLLEGAESLQNKLRMFAEEEKRKMTEEIKAGPLAETIADSTIPYTDSKN